MLGYDYPLLAVFGTLVIWFFWVAWVVLLVHILGDIFRNHDMSGASKGLWTILVVVLPWIGVFLYLIAHGGSMRDRDDQQVTTQDDALRADVRGTAANGATSTAEELTKLNELRAQGIISDAEFTGQKSKLLNKLVTLRAHGVISEAEFSEQESKLLV